MFFISWGSKLVTAFVGAAGLRHCAFCDKDAEFSRYVEYRVRHIYWIFRWVTEKVPFLQCGNCGASHAGDEGDSGSPEVRQAIPVIDRRGWAMGAGGVAALVGFGAVAAAADQSAERTYLAAPHVGDVYEADVAQMLKDPEAPVMYSALRVTRVDAGSVQVQMANNYYNQLRGVERDVSNGRALAADYYAPEKIDIPQRELTALYDQGVLKGVDR